LKQYDLKATTLFTSSPESWTQSVYDYNQSFGLSPPNSKGGGRLPLGVLVTGTFPDPYAGQPIPEWQKSEQKGASAPVSSLNPKPGQLIVVGCSEMFTEQIVASGGHLTFFLNAVDTLVSGGKLVGIRNKQQTLRILSIPSTAKRAWLRFLNLGLMPIVIVGVSLAHAAWRRRLREAYAGA